MPRSVVHAVVTLAFLWVTASSAIAAVPTVIAPSGASAWTYADLQDSSVKYEGGYSAFDDAAAGLYDAVPGVADAGPHGGYNTTTNKCKVCHAVHRAEGAYYLLRADSQDDACSYCHVGSAHSSRVVYDLNPDGIYTSNGHTIGASSSVPDSTISQWTQTVTLSSVAASGEPLSEEILVRAYSPEKNSMYRMGRHHAQSAGDYLKIGPLALRCMNCHQVHGADAQTWRPVAIANSRGQNGPTRAAYKLLKAFPSGTTWGDPAIQFGQTLWPLPQIALVPEDALVAGVNYDSTRAQGQSPGTQITSKGTAGRPLWVAQDLSRQGYAAAGERSDPATVNNAALSVWCADCHNLNIGGSQQLIESELGFKVHNERTHPVPFVGAFNGPGQCYSCHRSDLPALNDGDACSQCHYGTGNYYENRIDYAGLEYRTSDFPHSGGPDEYKLLGSYSVDVEGLNPTTIADGLTIGGGNLDAVCVRCHWVEQRFHESELGGAVATGHSTPSVCAVCHLGGADALHSETADGCGSCHDAATLTSNCATCHPVQANPDGTVIEHGYVAANHLSTETCLLGCHDADLGSEHDPGMSIASVSRSGTGDITVAATSSTACSMCHNGLVDSISPWDGTCLSCHATLSAASHPILSASHAGSDALVRDYTQNFAVRTSMSTRVYPFGCTPTASSGQRICHDVSNLAGLHEEASSRGCAICHDTDADGQASAAPATANECLTCHGTGWYNPATSAGTIARPGSDYSSSGAVLRVGGTLGNFSAVESNDADLSYLQLASTNAEAIFGRGTWWLNPNTTSITSVQVQFRAKKLGATTTTSRMTAVLNVGGTTYVSTAAATNPATAYTLYTHTFATNPKTGAAWTPQDLNDVSAVNGLRAFGVRQTVSDTANIAVTEVVLKVNTPATAYAAPPQSGGQEHHYGDYQRDPESGAQYSAVYYQYCADRCHAWPNTYAYYGDLENNVNYSPYRPYSGGWMWSSLMSDVYGTSPVVRKLTLEPVTLPADSPTLEFTTNWRLNRGTGTSSSGYVEISTDGGATYTELTGTVDGASRSSYSENASVWVPALYDLSAYAGQTVKLRFRFVDGVNGAAGWAVDDVRVSGASGVVFSDDAETLKPEWEVGQWRRIPFALSSYF